MSSSQFDILHAIPQTLVVPLDQRWTVSPADKPEEAIPAEVPGCIHLDLLRAGLIPDPFVADHEIEVEWVSRTAWTWRRTFSVNAELLSRPRVLLECDGLDTFGEIYINGHLIGSVDNMHRRWAFDTKSHLVQGKNEIEIRFRAILEVSEALYHNHPIPTWGIGPGGDKLIGGAWCRKAQCHFGWDWGPKLPTSGIWRSIRLRADEAISLNDLSIRQKHQDGSVSVDVSTGLQGQTANKELVIDVLVIHEDEVVGSKSVPAANEVDVCLDIKDPRLWWPNGLGDQPLYTVAAILHDNEKVYARRERRIGLRTLNLVCEKDEWGQSFHFEVNGHPFFAKGANWIPADSFPPRFMREDYERILGDAALANMNMLRIWGGGIYENDEFYDLCDELGICIWQDFMFACSTYPTFDNEWMENVRLEVEDNIERLRHHACLALWCGNNELEQGLVSDEWTDRTMSWVDYARLFDEMLPEIVSRLDPDRQYWPSSPHSPTGDRKDFNNDTCGDTHHWAVWHGRQPFEWYRTTQPRFCSEFGFQSFPEPRTVAGYAPPEERNITSYIMEHHQRSGIGNTTIIHYMLSWFRMPSGFEETIWLSQIIQAMAMKYAVEHWRRLMPRTMGAIYWQLNDCWPVASWSSIDYHGRWKALQYHARRFFSPLLLSIVEDKDKNTMELHLTNDMRESKKGIVHFFVYTTGGDLLREDTINVSIAAASTSSPSTIDLSAEVREYGARNLVFFAEFTVDGSVVSHNSAALLPFKHLTLHDPNLQITPEKRGISITARRPAFQIKVNPAVGEAVFTDNFIDLRPGQTIQLNLSRYQGKPKDILSNLEINSIYDLAWRD